MGTTLEEHTLYRMNVTSSNWHLYWCDRATFLRWGRPAVGSQASICRNCFGSNVNSKRNHRCKQLLLLRSTNRLVAIYLCGDSGGICIQSCCALLQLQCRSVLPRAVEHTKEC